MSYPVRAVRRRLQRHHGPVLTEISDCADRVADPWNGARTSDPSAITEPLRAVLEDRGILTQLPDVLADAVDATGHDLAADPVPAPPYVVVTSRGPVLRATIESGRLVIRFDAFTVNRDPTADGTVYRRRDGIVLDVSLR